MPGAEEPVIHLDTNYLVRGLVTGSPESGKIDGWMLSEEELGVSALAWGEYLCGPLTAAEETAARELIQTVEPVNRDVSELAARLFNSTGRRSRSFADCVIAATAIIAGARLATNNSADFSRFVSHGLVLA